MTIIACGIGQPPVGRERGIEERPHAEDGGQGKQNAPVTHGKTLPSSGFRFECDCERTNQAENSHKAQNLRLLTYLHRRLDANNGVTGSWLRFPVLSVRSWQT